MADPNNPGQFGNRSDTEEQARKGGKASGGKFGSERGADPHQAGKKGAQAQDVADKRKGGEHSHSGSSMQE